VKVLLQNKTTELYFKSESEWVQTATEACAFESSISALTLCEELKLSGVQVVFKFPNALYDFSILFDRDEECEMNQLKTSIPPSRTSTWMEHGHFYPPGGGSVQVDQKVRDETILTETRRFG
jgi:hypothetical protein